MEQEEEEEVEEEMMEQESWLSDIGKIFFLPCVAAITKLCTSGFFLKLKMMTLKKIIDKPQVASTALVGDVFSFFCLDSLNLKVDVQFF